MDYAARHRKGDGKENCDRDFDNWKVQQTLFSWEKISLKRFPQPLKVFLHVNINLELHSQLLLERKKPLKAASASEY